MQDAAPRDAIPGEIRYKLETLARYDFSYLRDLYDEDCPAGLSSFETAVSELRRFLTLVVVQDGPLAVTDRSVDRLWHTLVIHTEDYAEFCASIEGRTIEHRPHSDRRPVPTGAILNTFDHYARRFGVIPDSWVPGGAVTRAAVATRTIPADIRMRWSGWPGRG